MKGGRKTKQDIVPYDEISAQPGFSINLDDEFGFYEINFVDYMKDGRVDREAALRDMKRVIHIAPDMISFYLKSLCHDGYKLAKASRRYVMTILKSIVVGRETDVYQTGKDTFKRVTNIISLKTLFDENPRYWTWPDPTLIELAEKD